MLLYAIAFTLEQEGMLHPTAEVACPVEITTRYDNGVATIPFVSLHPCAWLPRARVGAIPSATLSVSSESPLSVRVGRHALLFQDGRAEAIPRRGCRRLDRGMPAVPRAASFR